MIDDNYLYSENWEKKNKTSSDHQMNIILPFALKIYKYILNDKLDLSI